MAEFTPTPGQALAISDRGGELLVSAAAGSGKTRVLIERLMGYILGENRADVDSFLIITFTRAAAEQLRGKIGEHISELAESATGGPRICAASAPCSAAHRSAPSTASASRCCARTPPRWGLTPALPCATSSAPPS